MTAERPPLVVATDERAAVATVEAARRAGLRVHEGWQLPPAPWGMHAERLVCVGEVRDEADRSAALLAAARGTGVVVRGAVPEALLPGLLEDLRRVGGVALADEPPGARPRLPAEDERLLSLLAEGLTVTEAARRLHLSRRTADRRLARARAHLGVATTAEAVVALAAGEARAGGEERP